MKNSFRNLIAVLLIGTAAILSAQSVTKTQSIDPDVVRLVTKIIASAPAITTSTDSKQFARMGDAAAKAIIQVIGVRNIDGNELDRILGVLQSAFERPSIIKHSADRSPVATRALLSQISAQPWDAGSLAKIKSAEQYILSAVTN